MFKTWQSFRVAAANNKQAVVRSLKMSDNVLTGDLFATDIKLGQDLVVKGNYVIGALDVSSYGQNGYTFTADKTVYDVLSTIFCGEYSIPDVNIQVPTLTFNVSPQYTYTDVETPVTCTYTFNKGSFDDVPSNVEISSCKCIISRNNTELSIIDVDVDDFDENNQYSLQLNFNNNNNDLTGQLVITPVVNYTSSDNTANEEDMNHIIDAGTLSGIAYQQILCVDVKPVATQPSITQFTISVPVNVTQNVATSITTDISVDLGKYTVLDNVYDSNISLTAYTVQIGSNTLTVNNELFGKVNETTVMSCHSEFSNVIINQSGNVNCTATVNYSNGDIPKTAMDDDYSEAQITGNTITANGQINVNAPEILKTYLYVGNDKDTELTSDDKYINFLTADNDKEGLSVLNNVENNTLTFEIPKGTQRIIVAIPNKENQNCSFTFTQEKPIVGPLKDNSDVFKTLDTEQSNVYLTKQLTINDTMYYCIIYNAKVSRTGISAKIDEVKMTFNFT